MKLWVAIVAVLVLAAPAKAALKWGPDRAFARIMATGFEKAYPTVSLTEIVCAKPLLPKRTAVTVGVAQEDCLLVSPTSCFEVVWMNGPLVQPFACTLVHKAIRNDAKPSWVVHFKPRLIA